ncbi:MAG: alpha-ketoacid dehydrogenase subunit beta [Acidobacteria bacterium]|nr:alpha-ketoacid dehydrogenase subunit beta [Acidobacteriota bacterium]
MAREVTVVQAIRETLGWLLESDEGILVFGEDVGKPGGVFGVTRGLQERFGSDRVFDTPISESAIVGAATGAAMMGLRPICEIMWIDFALLAMDQIINQAAKVRYMSESRLSVPIVIRTQQGVTEGSSSQHSQSFEALFAHIPGLKVVIPSRPADFSSLLIAAAQDPDPVLFIEHRSLYGVKGELPDVMEPANVGQAEVVRSGEDVTVISWGTGLHISLAAAQIADSSGLSVEVIDLRWLEPLDFASIAASVEKTGRAVVVHEAVLKGGFGAEVAARIAEECFWELDAPVRRVGAAFVPMPHAPVLQDAILPNARHLAQVLARTVQV